LQNCEITHDTIYAIGRSLESVNSFERIVTEWMKKDSFELDCGLYSMWNLLLCFSHSQTLNEYISFQKCCIFLFLFVRHTEYRVYTGWGRIIKWFLQNYYLAFWHIVLYSVVYMNLINGYQIEWFITIWAIREGGRTFQNQNGMYRDVSIWEVRLVFFIVLGNTTDGILLFYGISKLVNY